jgi:DNA repair protein SbcD/Mre11
MKAKGLSGNPVYGGPMRILHTADWHLGRIFHGVHLTDDQGAMLDEFYSMAKDAQPDCIVVAGDVYDRAVPPPDAVALLDDVVCRLVLDLDIAVLIIAGNHDSAARLDFGGRLLSRKRLFVVGTPKAAPDVVCILDEHGPVEFVLLPYADPASAKHLWGLADGESMGHGAAMRSMVRAAKETLQDDGVRRVVVAHGTVADAHDSDSERPLWLGATGAMAASDFAGFCYTALGHHHAAQDVDSARVRYAGSPLAYSFAESDQEKSATVVDLNGRGEVSTTPLPFTPRHAVRTVSGALDELLAKPSAANDHDYLRFLLNDDKPVLDPMTRLRKRYKNALIVEQEQRQPSAIARIRALLSPKSTVHSDEEALFAQFFHDVTNEDLNDPERAVVAWAVAQANTSEQERGEKPPPPSTSDQNP